MQASDVALEIERLKAEGMVGLVLDLRDNGWRIFGKLL